MLPKGPQHWPYKRRDVVWTSRNGLDRIRAQWRAITTDHHRQSDSPRSSASVKRITLPYMRTPQLKIACRLLKYAAKPKPPRQSRGMYSYKQLTFPKRCIVSCGACKCKILSRLLEMQNFPSGLVSALFFPFFLVVGDFVIRLSIVNRALPPFRLADHRLCRMSRAIADQVSNVECSKAKRSTTRCPPLPHNKPSKRLTVFTKPDSISRATSGT